MKKLYGALVLVLGVVLLTGCGGSKNNSNGGSSNGFKCTATMSEDGQSAKVEFDVKLDSDSKLKTADVTFDFEEKTVADQIYTLYTWINDNTEDENEKINISQKGTKITIKNYESIPGESDDENSLDNIVGMTKEEFKSALEAMETVSDVSCN